MKMIVGLAAGAIAATWLASPAQAQTFRPDIAGVTAPSLVEQTQSRRCRWVRRWEDGELVRVRECRVPNWGRRWDRRRDWDDDDWRDRRRDWDDRYDPWD
jgi:hypothetical protein